MVAVGAIVSFMLHLLVPFEDKDHKPFYNLLASVLITIIIWEGNLRMDTIINKYFPWANKPVKRILIHLPLSIIFSANAIYFCILLFNKYICELPPPHKELLISSSIIVGVLISITTLSIEISIQFFKQWKNSLVEIEKHKTESLQAQLQNLKNQINPHFLFNNLSVLSSLVYKDQDKAVGFINQLSKVYRYLLDNRNSELITLENELEFIHAYTYLLQIRFDKNILFDIQIETGKLSTLIPPMSLQMLIENAIKHNEVSSEQPLSITIKTLDDKLVVTNNLQLRSDQEPSSKTGLQNIKDRYAYFTDKMVNIIITSGSFSVEIPLLQAT
jgi:two-component system, LytTR family, sensor kinase